jgi:hypothetical protein
MTCDDPWAAGRGYTVGYIKGLLNSVVNDGDA